MNVCINARLTTHNVEALTMTEYRL
jgi:hypothetical protein